MDYYSELFPSSSTTNFTEILEAVQPKVTLYMNDRLLREFNPGEVHRALKQMYPLKAPGLDDMTLLFFQHF